MVSEQLLLALEVGKTIVTILSSVAVPIVLLVIGSRYTNTREMEAKLRQDRVEVYNKILEPFLLLYSTEAVIANSFKNKGDQRKSASDLASQRLLTLDYQDFAFKLSLIGSDEVLRAYNDLMQSFYAKESGNKLIQHIAELLLQIRKSLGNSSTAIQSLEMLEWKINDIRKFKVNGTYPNELPTESSAE